MCKTEPLRKFHINWGIESESGELKYAVRVGLLAIVLIFFRFVCFWFAFNVFDFVFVFFFHQMNLISFQINCVYIKTENLYFVFSIEQLRHFCWWWSHCSFYCCWCCCCHIFDFIPMTCCFFSASFSHGSFIPIIWYTLLAILSFGCFHFSFLFNALYADDK